MRGFSGNLTPAMRAAPLAILACLLWSSAFAAVKTGLRDMTPFAFAGVRFMLAGLILLPLCGRLRTIRAGLRSQWRVIALVCLFQTIILYGAAFYGMTLVGGAQAAVIIGSAPLVTALLAHVMVPGDRMRLAKTGAIALGMAGVVILAAASKPWSPAGLRALGGMGLLMVGVVAGQLGNIFVARHRGEFSPLLVNSVQMGVGGVVLFAAALAVEGPPALPPVRFLLPLIWLAGVSAAGFSIWFHLLRKVKVSQLNVWKFLIPLFGAIFSWLLLAAESPDVVTVVGMVCVVTAVLLAQWRDVRAASSNAAALRK